MCYTAVVLRGTNARGANLKANTLGDAVVLAAYEEVRIEGRFRYRHGNITYYLLLERIPDQGAGQDISVEFEFPFRHRAASACPSGLPADVCNELCALLDNAVEIESSGMAGGTHKGFRNWYAQFLEERFGGGSRDCIEEFQNRLKTLSEPPKIDPKRLQTREHGDGFQMCVSFPADSATLGELVCVRVDIEQAWGSWSRYGEGATTLMTSSPSSEAIPKAITLMHLTRFYVSRGVRFLDPEGILFEGEPFASIHGRKWNPCTSTTLAGYPSCGCRFLLKWQFSGPGQVAFFNIGVGPSQQWALGWRNSLSYSCFRIALVTVEIAAGALLGVLAAHILP